MTSGAELAAAESLLEVGRADDARRRVVTVVAAEPDNVDALCLLARCLIELDEAAAALDSATSATRHAPDRPEAHILRAGALLQLDRAAEALEGADTAVALDGERAAAHLVRALALFNTFRRREAWTALHETTRLAPEWAEAHAIQGTMHYTFGRHRKARHAYQRALALQPEHTGAIEGLAQLSLRRGRPGAALRQFGAAAALAPAAQSAAAGVDRALTNLCGLALATAWLSAGTLAVAGRYLLAWLIAAAVLVPYLVWFRAFRRRTPPHLWAAVRARMTSDPRPRIRLLTAGITLAAGVLIGLVAAVLSLDTAVPGIFGMIGWLMVIAGVIFAVDVGYARRRVAAGGDALAGLSPDEQANVQVGRLALRWFRATALLAIVPSVLAAEPAADLSARASTGTAVIALVVAYYRWTRRMWRRRPGRPLTPGLAHLVPVAYVLLGLLWLAIVVGAYWPGQPPGVVAVAGFGLGACTVVFLVVWLPIQGVRRVVRYLTTSRT